MFEMRIETSNAVFTGANRHAEVARILRKLANEVEVDGGRFGSLAILDSNGNSVGVWAYEPPESCDECGEDAVGDNEGWDGLCGRCADALEDKEVDDRREQP